MTFRSHARSFPGMKVWTFRSRERNCLVTFVLTNWRLLQLSAVAVLGRRPTRYSMHHYELFNYDYRGVVVSFQGTKVHGNETSIIRCTSVRLAGKGLAEMFTSRRSEYNWALTRLGRDVLQG